MRTFVLFTDVLLSLYLALFKCLSLHPSNDLCCAMSVTSIQKKSHISRTRDLMLKRDTTSSLNICCDIIRDIIEARSTSSLSFTRDVIQEIIHVLRKPWSLSDLGENLNDTFTRLLLLTCDWLSLRTDTLSSLRILQLHSPPWSGYILFTDGKAWCFWCWWCHKTYAIGYVHYHYH